MKKSFFPWIDFYRKSLQNAKFRPLAIILTMLYFLSPIDIIPDILVPFGFIDDTVLAGIFVMELISIARNRPKHELKNDKKSNIVDVETKSL